MCCFKKKLKNACIISLSSFWLALLLVLTVTSANAAPTARFTARKIQGPICVAPCAVHFDAIGMGALSPVPYVTQETTDPDFPREFHTLDFRWNFGDAGSGTWQHTGASKNTAIGAIAGHVYENPGVYTISLTVTNPNTQSNSTTRSVTVVDPGAHFSDAATFCFANNANNWSGCPLNCAGGNDNCTVGNDLAVLLNQGDNCSGSFDCANADQDRVRVLLRAGDTFNNTWGGGTSLSDSTTQPALISRFGTGANPIVTNDLKYGSGWTATGIDVVTSSTWALFIENPDDQITFYKNNVTKTGGSGNCLDSSSGVGSIGVSNLIAAVEISCIGTHPNSDTMVWPAGNYTMWLGLTVDRNGGTGTGAPYTMRSKSLQHTIMAHTSWLDPDPRGHHWSFRAEDDAFGWTPQMESAMFNIISDNRQELESIQNAWLNRVCNDSGCNCTNGTNGSNCYADGSGKIVSVHDWIFERNIYRYNSGPAADKLAIFDLQGGGFTVRNETVELGGASTNTNFAFIDASGQTPYLSGGPVPSGDYNIHNNTIIASGSYSSTLSLFRQSLSFGKSGCTSNCVSRNNTVVWTPGWNGALGHDAGVTFFNDIVVTNNTPPAPPANLSIQGFQ